MNGLIDELKLICLATAIATAFGACGGGGGDTAVAAAPAAEVFVTMVRGINNGETRNGVRVLDNDATTVIVAVANVASVCVPFGAYLCRRPAVSLRLLFKRPCSWMLTWTMLKSSKPSSSRFLA